MMVEWHISQEHSILEASKYSQHNLDYFEHMPTKYTILLFFIEIQFNDTFKVRFYRYRPDAVTNLVVWPKVSALGLTV